MDSNSREK